VNLAAVADAEGDAPAAPEINVGDRVFVALLDVDGARSRYLGSVVELIDDGTGELIVDLPGIAWGPHSSTVWRVERSQLEVIR
jgi:hypothetical protein